MRKSLSLAISAIVAASNIAIADNAINEVVVTAAKREQTLQEVPIAVSVTSGDTIEQAQIRDLTDLQSIVPSLRVEPRGNSAATNFFIRGFGNGDNNPGIEPSVGVFIDGVYRSRSAAQIADLPSVERIEVLRGPQSTLFGKNASAGVISIVTRKPQYELGGGIELSYGNYDATVVKAHITGPISETVAYGLSANINQRDGYFDIVNLGTDQNTRDRWDLRGDLLIEPSDDLSIRFISDFGRIEDQCCGAANVVADPGLAGLMNALAGGTALDFENPFSYNIYQNNESFNDIDNYGFSAQVDYELENYSITSITSYREVEAAQVDDRDFSALDLIGPLGDGSEIETFTQEIRLTSNFDGPFNFLLGAYYFDEKVIGNSGLIFGPAARAYVDTLVTVGSGGTTNLALLELGFPIAGEPFFADGSGFVSENYNLDNDAVSIFGSFDYSATDRLTATFGFNYTEDSKELSTNVVNTDTFAQVVFPPIEAFDDLRDLQFLPQFVDVPNVVEDGKTDDDEWTWTIRLAYDVTDNTNVYASWATGFKASSVNLSRDSRPLASDIPALQAAGLGTPNLVGGSRFAGPEESEVVEIGLKTVFEYGSINVAIFDQTIEGFQSNVFTGTGFQLSNAGEQSTRGWEFEGNFTPTDSLDLFVAVTWLDPEYDSFEQSAFGDLSGREPANIAETTISLGGSYTYAFDDGKELRIRADYAYESETQLRDGFDEAVPASFTQSLTREVKLLNAAATLALTNGVELSLWGRNLTDNEYLISAFDAGAQPGNVSGYPNQPRTYGGSVRFKF